MAITLHPENRRVGTTQLRGNIVIWDNLTLQHARGLAGSGIRTLQRVTIADLGYAEQYPTDIAIYDLLGNDAMLETA